MKYEVILLDCGGTLSWPPFDRFNQIMRKLTGAQVPVETQYQAYYRSNHALDDYIRSNRSYPGHDGLTLNNWVFEKGLELEGFPGAWNLDCTIELIRRDGGVGMWDYTFPWIAEALHRLHTAGYRLAVCSNADGQVKGLLERLGYAKYLETITDSTVEGVAKPDPELFYISLRRMGLERYVKQAKAAARGEGEAPPVLYIGDSYRNDVVGSQNAGLDYLLIDPLELFADWTDSRIIDMSAAAEMLCSQADTGSDQG